MSGSPAMIDWACGVRSAAVSGRVVLLVTVMLYFGPQSSLTFWTHFAPAAVSAWAVAILIGLAPASELAKVTIGSESDVAPAAGWEMNRCGGASAAAGVPDVMTW